MRKIQKTFAVKTIGITLFILCILLFIPIVEGSGAPSIEWSMTYGGTTYTRARQIIQTSDGGYALIGERRSDDVGAGGYDFWLVKTNQNGTMEWNKIFGGAYNDEPRSFVQTPDGGYLLAGYSLSFSEYQEIFLVKTDNNGVLEWNTTHRMTDIQWPTDCIITTDNEYVLTGVVDTSGLGTYDAFLMKINEEGTIRWNMTYGGSGAEEPRSVIQTSDGGFLISCTTSSYGSGGYDIWLIKTDQNGTVEWNNTYGGTDNEVASTAIQTSDGSFVVGGSTRSYGVNDYDFWLIKTDQNGVIEWNRTYGGKQKDICQSLIQTIDGGYALAGYTKYLFYDDYYLVKTNHEGYMEWWSTYSGNGDAYALSLIQTNDNGYALAGYVQEFKSNNFYLVKTQTASETQNLYPIAYAGDDVNISVGETLTFDSSNSYDPDGTIIQVQWDFDGNGAFDWSSNTTGETTYEYSEPGKYGAVLEITDDNGLTYIDVRNVEVAGTSIEDGAQGEIPGEIWIGSFASLLLFFISVAILNYVKNKKKKKSKKPTSKFLKSLLNVDIWIWYLVLSFFVILSIKFTASFFFQTPMIYVDEHAYGIMAHDIFQGKLAVILETPISSPYPAGYPLLLSPAYLFGDNVDGAYRGMLFLNCVLSTLLVFPVFFIMKRFVSEKQSLLTSILIAFLPTILVHNYLLMSENAFYLLFLISCFLVIKTYSYDQFDRTFIIYSLLLGICIGFLLMVKATGVTMLAALIGVFIITLIKKRNRSTLKHVLALIPLLLASIYVLFNPSFAGRYSISQYSDIFSQVFSDSSQFARFLTVFFNEINYLVLMSYLVFMAFAVYLIINRKALSSKIKRNLSPFSLYGLLTLFFLIIITTLHIVQYDISIYTRYLSAGLPLVFMLGVIGLDSYKKNTNPKKHLHMGVILLVLGLFVVFFFPVGDYYITNTLDLIWILSARSVSFLGGNGFTIILGLLGILVAIIFILFVKSYYSKKPLPLVKYLHLDRNAPLILAVVLSLVLFLPSATQLMSEQQSIQAGGYNEAARWFMKNDPDAHILVEDSYSAYIESGMYDLDWQFMYVHLHFWIPNGIIEGLNRSELRNRIVSDDISAHYILSTHDLTQYYPIVTDIIMNIPVVSQDEGTVIWHIYEVNPEIE